MSGKTKYEEINAIKKADRNPVGLGEELIAGRYATRSTTSGGGVGRFGARR